MRWITAEEAMRLLKVRPQTLYAYVSRGRIAARPDPADSRRSQYAEADIERLTAARRRGRRTAAVAEATMSFGEPVLTSAITTIEGGWLFYRGRDAVQLSETATLEDTCGLLWGCEAGEQPFPRTCHAGQSASADPGPRQAAPFVAVPALRCASAGMTMQSRDAKARMFALLAGRAANDPVLSGRAPALLRADAGAVLSDLVEAVCGAALPGLLHQRLATAWGVGESGADLIRRILVLCADHELHTSAFAARVTASTGANLAACALAGLAALSGPLHGGAAAQVCAFLDDAERTGDARACALRLLAQGFEAPGFGHLLYPQGDPRAAAMATARPWRPDIADAARACEAVTGQAPNIDFALVAAARTLQLPADAPFCLFAVAKCAGWFAHALEQRASGQVIRPRARYAGPSAGSVVDG